MYLLIIRRNLQNQCQQFGRCDLDSIWVTSGAKPLCESGTCELYLTLIGDLIIGADYQITVDDTVIKTKEMKD